MCSIIGSFSKNMIIDLVGINQYRGNFSYSITCINYDKNIIAKQVKEFGEFNEDILSKMPDNMYYICHVQAPTGGLIQDLGRIHPTKSIDESYLWHNGIIMPCGISYIQTELNTNITFDTKLLHEYLNIKKWHGLSDIEGLFVCLYYFKHNLYMFRTKHGKLYIDDELNISSERFKNSKCINFDKIYKLNLQNKCFDVVDSFKTKKFNIVIRGEL